MSETRCSADSYLVPIPGPRVQYGISSGSMAWTLDVSRTCDKFWFGVTVDKDLDCNDWIADHDAAYMISEEGEIEEKTYENYVPKTVRPHHVRRVVGCSPCAVAATTAR
jgi:hypothetical protein